MDPKLEFLPLLLILFLAFLVPPLLARFRWLPVVVGGLGPRGARHQPVRSPAYT